MVVGGEGMYDFGPCFENDGDEDPKDCTLSI